MGQAGEAGRYHSTRRHHQGQADHAEVALGPDRCAREKPERRESRDRRGDGGVSVVGQSVIARDNKNKIEEGSDMKKLAVIACSWLMLVAGLVHTARADEFPVKSIRIVVPFPAGGTTDILARSVAQALGEKLGVTTFVENRAGASGTIGSELVAKSPA